MVCMTLNCVGITQSSVIRIIHRNWSESFFHIPKFLVLSLVFAYFYISQGRVEMHLRFYGPQCVFYFRCLNDRFNNMKANVAIHSRQLIQIKSRCRCHQQIYA